jgi:hypothetical protein
MNYLKAFALAGCLLAIGVGPVRAQQVFSFENATLGDLTDTTVSPTSTFDVWSDDGSLKATFEALSSSSQYTVSENTVGDPPITGQQVFGGKSDLVTGGEIGEAILKITFDTPLSSFGFDFVIGAGAAALENADLAVGLALNGASPTTVATLTGSANSFGWFQGSSGLLGLGGARFDTVYLTGGTANSAFVAYGIDNVSAAAVPEPGTVAFLLGGLVPLALRLRRRA